MRMNKLVNWLIGHSIRWYVGRLRSSHGDCEKY